MQSCAPLILNKLKDFRQYFIVNSILFVIILSSFSLVSQSYFFAYALILGLLGGGLPTVWIQVVTKSYGTNQRNTATNTLYVIGRGSSIGFNLLISYWLASPKYFSIYCIITAIIIAGFSILAAKTSKNMYISEIDYLE